MSQNKQDLIIVGGGIGGLGLAHMALRAGLRPLVLEASDRLGGALHSHRFGAGDDAFWVEMGAHTCYNSYGQLIRLLEDLDALDQIQEKQKLGYKIRTDAGLKGIASQLNFFALLPALPNLFFGNRTGRTVGDYFSGIVGRGNYRRVLGPALDAVICQDAEAFPAEALFRKKPRRKEIVRHYTGHNGVSTFVQRIADQEGLAIQLNTRVLAVTSENGGYRVNLESGKTLIAARLVFAVAPDIASRLIRELSEPMAERLAGIQMAEIESVAVQLKKEHCPLPPLAGIISAQDSFFSAVSRDPVPSSDYRGLTFHFRPQGLSLEQKLLRIAEVMGVRPDAFIGVAECPNRLPALRLGHEEQVRQLDNWTVDTNPGLGFTGNWFSGVSIEDTLIRSAEVCERLTAV